jgi:hypothetical protein
MFYQAFMVHFNGEEGNFAGLRGFYSGKNERQVNKSDRT